MRIRDDVLETPRKVADLYDYVQSFTDVVTLKTVYIEPQN
jgi:hypothetical protein